MPIPSEIGHTFRVRAPSVYERGVAQTVSMECRLGGSLVTPASGTMTLRSPTGSTAWTGSVTITGGIATAAVSALASTVAYGDGYREEWSLVIGSTTTVGAREAYVARRALHCPVTQADLESRHPRLATLMGTAATDLQGFVDEAWSATLQKLTSAGRWPESIVEPTSLRGYVQAHALYLIFRSMLTSTQPNTDRYASLAEGYRIEAATLWADVRFRSDADQDGVADTADRKGAAQVVRRAVAGWPVRYRRGVL